jgi:hypothetical protein
VNKDEYRRYRHSPHWQAKGQEIRQRSGGRCEHVTYDGPEALRHKLIYSGAHRCELPADDVHHLTYERLGGERAEDLIHLCRRHHLMMHVMAIGCVACTTPLLEEFEALALIDESDPEGDLEWLRQMLTWDERFQSWDVGGPEEGWLCLACSQAY